MKPVSEILHRTPWWALIFGGLATFAALAVFVTPYHIIDYVDDGRSADESRAIRREIDNTFAENAISVGRGVVRRMLERTTDPARRAELEEALRGLEEARVELREAGSEVLRVKREALEAARASTRELRDAVRRAQEEARKALKGGGPEAEAALRELEKSLREAERAQREAARELARAQRGRSLRIGPSPGEGPAIEVEIDPPEPPAPPAPGDPASPQAESAPEAVAPPLPPEVARKIRRDVTADMYRIGLGAALLLVLLPLFVVAIIAKFFLDRSRASQRVAETKRKEADYHRMSQQVTEAKLAALQAQVEPHFLYNTLASVQALTEVDPARASEMTGHLIQYLRNALPKMRESVSTVGQEIELARAYLSILQMRMGERLTFTIDVPEELAGLPFPPLMLPSLVENAIKHGLEPQRGGGSVAIRAERDGERLRLIVAATGRGFGDTVGAGVGLANIRERLAALYGERARLTLELNAPSGVVATIEVPAAGTRAGAAAPAAAPASAHRVPPPPAPPVSPAPPGPPPTGFWPRTWEVLVALERVWRVSLYYVYLGLMAVAAIAAIAGIVGVSVGAIPVEFDEAAIAGPGGAFVGLAVVIIALVVVAAALGIVLMVVYALGFLLLAVLVFVAVVVLVSVSPILAPVVLAGFGIWWLARRARRRQQAPEPDAAPAADPNR